jgi:hypothetical protein
VVDDVCIGANTVRVPVYAYHERYDIPGNCYAWFVMGRHCLPLLGHIANAATINTPQKSIRKCLTSTETSGQRGGCGVPEFLPGFGKPRVLGKWMA